MGAQNKSSYLFQKHVAGSAQSSEQIAHLVLELAGPINSVVDLGGGTGAWLREFQRLGVSDIRLFDSPKVEPHLVVPRDCFMPVDLEREAPSPTRADLAMCLECAEHVSKTRAEPIVQWLTSAADIVLFSAAVIGQGGTLHINEQFPGFWLNLFRARGFHRRDVIRKRILSNQSIEWWYRQNLFFFVKDGRHLNTEEPDFLPEEFSIIHRTVETSIEHPRLSTALRRVLPSLSASIKNRLGLN